MVVSPEEGVDMLFLSGSRSCRIGRYVSSPLVVGRRGRYVSSPVVVGPKGTVDMLVLLWW